MGQPKECIPWNKGLSWSSEVKAKISKTHQGKSGWSKGLTKDTDERLMNISNSLMGHIISTETKRKIGSIHKGKLLTEEHKRKISLNSKRVRPWALGKSPSQETRNKISISNKGRSKPVGFGERISETRIRLGLSKGDNNPFWINGRAYEPYTETFSRRFRLMIRKRDNHICLLCMKHSEKLNCALHIHHINYDKTLSIPENCLSLCKNCHAKTNFNRMYWTPLFQSLLSSKYGYKYNNQKIILEVENEDGECTILSKKGNISSEE